MQRQKEESDKILEKQKEILKELVEHKKQDSAQNYVKKEEPEKILETQKEIVENKKQDSAQNYIKTENQQGDSNQNLLANPRQDEQIKPMIIPLEEVKQRSLGGNVPEVRNNPEIAEIKQQKPVIPQQQIVPQEQRQANIQHLNNPNSFKQDPVQQNKQQVIEARGSQMNIQKSKNLANNQNPQVPVKPASNQNIKKLDEYNIKADIKQGLAAYDQEQRDLVHPILKTDRDGEGKVPGRDLKEERPKRSASEDESWLSLDTNCDNDPLCSEKFSRNPLEDSLIDRDLTKFLQVGSRALLEAPSDSNNNTDMGI